nr:PREDICTED: anoctamin-9-like isoform X3 [Paralichthys olivaceus]
MNYPVSPKCFHLGKNCATTSDMFFKTPERSTQQTYLEEGFELWDRQKDGTEPLLSSMPTHRTFDYILVAHKEDDDTHQKAQRQRAFIQQLEKKSISITVSDSCNWCGDVSGVVTQATRIRIVHFILHQTFINTGENLKELLMKDVFETIFCLHERKKQKQLKREWARWSGLFTGQPVNDVKCYFGEKVALYYLWLGWYTKLLVPAAAVGVVVFLYGLAFFNTNPLIKEVCNSSTIMCPRCDNRCTVWQLSDTCAYAKVN